MTKEEIFAYRESIALEKQKRIEFNASIAELRQEIVDKENAFKASIKNLTTKNDIDTKTIEKDGKEILKNIFYILRDKYGWYYPDYAVEEFDIIITNEDKEINENDDDEEESAFTYKINLNCKLDYIKEITDTSIIFKASQDFQDGDYAFGTISIPIKYFEHPELLKDKDYINNVFKNIKIRDNEAKAEEKAAKIAELEAELAKLKRET